MHLVNPFDGTAVEISKDMPVSRVQRLEARTPDGRYVSHANDATVVHYRMRQHPRSQLVRVTRRGGRSGARGSAIGKALGDDALRVGGKLVRGAGAAMPNMRNPAIAGGVGLAAGMHRQKVKDRKAAAAAGLVGKRYATDRFGKSSADRTVLADRRGVNSNIPDGARRGRRIDGDVSKGLGSAVGRLVRAVGGGPEAGVARGLSMVAAAPKPTSVPRAAANTQLRRRLLGAANRNSGIGQRLSGS